MKIRLHFLLVSLMLLLLVVELTRAGYKGDYKKKNKGRKGVEGKPKEAQYRYSKEPRQKEVKYKKSKRSVEDYDLKLVDEEEQPNIYEENKNLKRQPTLRTTITSKVNKIKSAQKQHQHTKHEQREQENIQNNPVEEEFEKDIEVPSPRRKLKNEKTKAFIEQHAEELEEIELEQEEPILPGPKGIKQEEEVQEEEEQIEEEEIYYVISSNEKPTKKRRKICYYE